MAAAAVVQAAGSFNTGAARHVGADADAASVSTAPGSLNGGLTGLNQAQQQNLLRAAHGTHHDASGLKQVPPSWVLQQLAQHLRVALKLNLFNVDILVPECQEQDERGQQQYQQHYGDNNNGYGLQKQQQHGSLELQRGLISPGLDHDQEEGNHADNTAGVLKNAHHQEKGRQGQQEEGQLCCFNGTGPGQDVVKTTPGTKQLVVVDINYFPGYDKVPGAEALFADFLASCIEERPGLG
jgi:hypothetical protein